MFTVILNTDNDAFQPDPQTELARILEHLVHSTRMHDLEGIARCGGIRTQKIFDANGNVVGSWTFDGSK